MMAERLVLDDDVIEQLEEQGKATAATVPEVGEVRELTGLSWRPWVLVTRVEPDAEGNLLARFAVLDEMDDDVLTPVPPGLVQGLEQTIGDRSGRRELAEVVDADPNIDKRWCPVSRLDVLGEAAIQGCNRDKKEEDDT